MNKKILVILAAGVGSRFGGPKQLYPIGPNGEFIVDYSIYSAIKYGFTKVVFVTREELLKDLKSTIGKRIANKIEVSYVIQDMNNIPKGFKVPDGRAKPWGTAHAIYCAKDEVDSNFAVIASDDFYGDEGIKDLSAGLDLNKYFVIGYKLGDTLSKNGTVKRGVVISKNGLVKDIIESECYYDKDIDKVVCTPLDKSKSSYSLPTTNSVSMLMYGFTPEIMKVLDEEIVKSFNENKNNLDSFEFLMPDVMALEIKRGKEILDIPTKSKWLGLTYQEDIDELKKHILDDIDAGVYPNKLW